MKNNIIPFYKFRAEAGDEPAAAELLIFDVIGDWEELGEVSAKAFAQDLSALPRSVKRLDIHINSPGGSVSEAQAIYSRLADHPSNKHVFIDGIAASAASIIAMVGHKVYIRANGTLMIHLPMTIGIGNADEMRKAATALDSITEGMINVYAKRTGLDREELTSLMRAETWFSAEKAVEKGFADEVRGVIKAAAIVGEKRVMINGATFDLSRFRNVPAFTGQQQQPTERETSTMAEQNPTQPTPPAAPPQPAAPTQPASAPTPPQTTPTPPTQPAAPAQPAAQPVAATAASTTQFDDGVQAERARIAALQAYDRPSTHELITNAIKDGKTVNDIMPQLFTAIENANGQQARREDAAHLNVPAGDAPRGSAQSETQKRFAADLTSSVKAIVRTRNPMRMPAGQSAN